MRHLKNIIMLSIACVIIHNPAKAEDQVATGRDSDLCPTALDLTNLKETPDFNATFYHQKGFLSRAWKRVETEFGEPVTNHKLTSGAWLAYALSHGAYGKVQNYKYVWLVNEGAMVNAENGKIGDPLYFDNFPNTRCFYTNEGKRVTSGNYSIAFFFRNQ